jgi:chromosome segregation ATPase
MSLFSLRPRAFRTRNSGRDAETDEARFGTIRNAISMALADARRERDGLSQRLDFYYAQATTLMDNSGEYGQRDGADETAINTAGQNASRARQRIAHLDSQIVRLEELLAQLDQTMAAPAMQNRGFA